jgi:hypothetical protein
MRISRGDRVTANSFPGLTLQVIACFGDICGCTCEQWPMGATHPVKLWAITSINGIACEFPKPETNTLKRRRKAA